MTTVLELAVAGLYLAGATFNAAYTLRNPESFYGSFAERAWLPPARRFMDGFVIPRGRALTIALIAFQLAVAGLILASGDLAVVGLLAGAGFSLAAALVSSPAGTAGNLALAVLQTVLAVAA